LPNADLRTQRMKQIGNWQLAINKE